MVEECLCKTASFFSILGVKLTFFAFFTKYACVYNYGNLYIILIQCWYIFGEMIQQINVDSNGRLKFITSNNYLNNILNK